jgi:hypothetical protein
LPANEAVVTIYSWSLADSISDNGGYRQCCVVALGEQGGRERPRYPELRIVESDGHILGRVMRAVDPIGDVRGLGERLKSMRTTRWDVDRLARVVV